MAIKWRWAEIPHCLSALQTKAKVYISFNGILSRLLIIIGWLQVRLNWAMTKHFEFLIIGIRSTKSLAFIQNGSHALSHGYERHGVQSSFYIFKGVSIKNVNLSWTCFELSNPIISLKFIYKREKLVDKVFFWASSRVSKTFASIQ